MMKGNYMLKYIQHISQETLFSHEIAVVEKLLFELIIKNVETQIKELHKSIQCALKNQDFNRMNILRNEIKKLTSDINSRKLHIQIKYASILSSSAYTTCFGNHNFIICLPSELHDIISKGVNENDNSWTQEMIEANNSLRRMLYHELGHILLAYSNSDKEIVDLYSHEEEVNTLADELQKIFKSSPQYPLLNQNKDYNDYTMV